MPRRSNRLLALGFKREQRDYREAAVNVFKRRRGSTHAQGSGSTFTGPSRAPPPDHCVEEEVHGASSLTQSQAHSTDGANDHPTGNSTRLYWQVVSLILLLILGLQFMVLSQWPAGDSASEGSRAEAEGFMDQILRKVFPAQLNFEDKLESVVSKIEDGYRTQMLQMKAEMHNSLRILQRQHFQLEQVVQMGRESLLISEQLWARTVEQGRALNKMKADVDARIRGVNETASACQGSVTEIQHNLEQRFTEQLSERCGRPVADEMADFALASQGGHVLTHLCSPSYLPNACTFSSATSWFLPRSPSTVIQGQPDRGPGECWAFAGSSGHLVVSLSHLLNISHVTLDHVAPRQTPTGSIPSAPRNILVYGLSDCEGDAEGSLLGDFVYDAEGEPSQTFALHARDLGLFQLVRLSVRTNWGHPDYTCLYRLRVHGDLPPSEHQ